MKVTAPLAAIVCCVIVCLTGAWLTLVLTGKLPVGTGIELVSHVGAFLTGVGLPIVYKRQGNAAIIQIDSDPPGAPEDKPKP